MEIEVLNPAPTYAKFIDLITPELATTLKDLVQDKGIASQYCANANCKEHRLPNVFTGSLSKEEVQIISQLHAITEPVKEIANQIFRDSALATIITHAGFWIMEYSEGGTFEEHVDYCLDDDGYSTAALATLAINLSEDDTYEGGEMRLAKKELFPQYCGAYLWDGWTNHEVKPITQGKRYVLVVHFTGLMKG